MKKFLTYQILYTKILASNGQNVNYSPQKTCNGLTIKNTNLGGGAGSFLVINRNIRLECGDSANQIPGESFAIGGNYGEVFDGRINLSFENAGGECEVIEKYYTNFDELNNSQF